MVKTDLFEQEVIVLRLDKPYVLRFTLRVVYQLERRYGNIKAAMDALFSGTVEESVVAAACFVYVMTGIEKERVDDLLDVNTYRHVLDVVLKLVGRDFPTNESDPGAGDGDTDNNTHDWDEMYFFARYRLRMSDDEFWACTPRRYWKLNYLWGVHHGLAQPEDEIFMGEVEY
jgi:hypothetical protein